MSSYSKIKKDNDQFIAVPLAGREPVVLLLEEEQKRKELQDRVEGEMRYRIDRDRNYQSRVSQHELENKLKYRKLTLNAVGLKEYTFDSNGNPITVRKGSVKPKVREIIKPAYKFGKHHRKAG